MPGFLFFSVFLMSQIRFSKCEYLSDISFTYVVASLLVDTLCDPLL